MPKLKKKTPKSAPKRLSGSSSRSAAPQPIDAASLIDQRIMELREQGGAADGSQQVAWRGDVLARVRRVILNAGSARHKVVEEWKWGVPVWSNAAASGGGIICTGEAYKNVVKLTFAKGASLADPTGFFNSSLEGNTRRAVDFHEGDRIDEKALKAIVRAAIALNASRRLKNAPARSSAPVRSRIGRAPNDGK